jgi:peptidylprolyl isomerase
MPKKILLYSLLLSTMLLVALVNTNAYSAAYKGEYTMSAESPVIVLETNQGNIQIQLFTDSAPKTCENFVGLVKKGYYDGLIFHRVIKNFMIQGGDPTGTGRGGKSLWGGKFEDEVTNELRFDKKGLLAMANSGPNTNGSQFFITTVPTPHLNMKHTIFGEVIVGYEVIEAIENTPKGPGDRPTEEQKIIKAYILE